MHLYLGESPRTIYLVTSSQEENAGKPSKSLVFRAAENNPSQAVVEFLNKDEVDLSNVVRLTTRVVKGCLGLISIGSDLFVAVVTSATELGNARPSAQAPEIVAKIHEVQFFSLTSSTWDDLTSVGPDALPSPSYADQADLMAMRAEYQSSQPNNTPLFEHPCAPLTKILSSGSFYYALGAQWDISTRLAERLDRGMSPTGAFDERFVWNEYIVRSLLDFRARLDAQERDALDRCHFIVLAIQGFVGMFTLALPAPPTDGMPTVATICLISRLGWKRAGTRFNTRGVDDDGHCANFVETETLLSTDQHCFSYTQVRGSVPLFWEQQGIQTFSQRIQITRPHASQPAFERHFSQLTDEYGAVNAINLLGSKDHEAALTSAYAKHISIAKSIWGSDIGITHFDFHHAVKLGGHDSVVRDLRRVESVSDNVDRFGFTMCDAGTDEVITHQKGVFRTNCLDCLDRTNFVQDILSRTMLEQYLLLVRREWTHSTALWSYHRELWAENGDALSRIYAGTGALNTSFTRSGKRTLAGVLSDATKSVSRAYINNFQDKGKQVAIDMFLGNLSNQKQVSIFDPIHDSVRAVLEQRLPEYSSTKQCSIFVGTWNLNGRPPSESLLPWLFPKPGYPDPDMFVLGFQEIVPLTAQQIVQTDPEKKRMWETRILDTLDRRPNKKCNYVLLRSEQLVGTALIVVMKSELISVVRNVEATARKTGLRGMSGNKGAVGIRLDFHDTSFCFLTAHLAAGHANVEERNADYRTIASGLHFLRGKTIDSHDNVVWLADTNYRIDLDNDMVRSLAHQNDYDGLLAADQLKQAIDSGAAFGGYAEGPIQFRPTYRYDLGTDNYDTSEKMRIPAWTDRILYKGHTLELSEYSRAELRGSDHRPVYAVFQGTVHIIDPVKRANLSRLLLESVTATAPGEKLDEKLAALTFPSEFEDSLPPPSSEHEAWWDDPDHPRGALAIPDLLSLARDGPTNPFDSPYESPLSASPSSSDEELFNHALSLPTPMIPLPSTKKPPPPPPPRPKPTGNAT
ncbi:inositol polyphosphate phosphatase [Dentipellis sp. KUC8613]|nr:inositol polyphosphate phosphatase [Dentipellis sp. KUC8613]